MTQALDNLTIKGFKSIRALENFELTNLNVLIGGNRKEGASVFNRLNKDELSSWLNDYSLGDLWRKNIVTGGPAHE